MRKATLLVLLLLPLLLHAQGQWAYMNGTTTNLSPPSYGTQGVPSPTNTPGYRYESMRWTDKFGNFWLFGGQCMVGGPMADLWKYDVSTNEWTWMQGPSVGTGAMAVYGTQGVFAPTNHPAGSMFGSCEFVDKQGNLWLLEGDEHQNMWKYDMALNMWAWMQGAGTTAPVPPVYGTQGVPAATNIPEGTFEHHGSWVDTTGMFWMYGGNVNGPSDCSNVLWRFDPATNMWAWINGTPNTYVAPNFGTKGVAAPSNTPGSRNVYATWLGADNCLYLWGSAGFCATGQHYNDVWKYDIVSGLWTWVAGSSAPNGFSGSDNAGPICSASTGYYPNKGDESHTNAQWDACDNFYLYGGDLGNAGTASLWRYTVGTGEWAWVSGQLLNNVAPSYGTFQVPSASNHPGNEYGNVAWVDRFGNYWLFGGGDPDYTSAFWRYTPESPTLSFSMDTALCVGDTVWFTNTTSASCSSISSYSWNFGDPNSGSDNNSSLTNPFHVFQDTGNFVITMIARSCGDDADTLTHQLNISGTSAGAGPDATICPGETAQLTAHGGTSYAWSPAGGLSDSTIASPVATPAVTTTYTVTIDRSGCEYLDMVTVTVLGVNDPLCSDCGALEIPNVFSPNADGVNDQFTIQTTCPYALSIYDRWGVLVWQNSAQGVYWDGRNMKSNKAVSDGTYYYILSQEAGGATKTHTGFVTVIR